MSRQRLGQHFLIRGSILERIAQAACAGREPLVIEIGAGRGALTRHLLAHAERVIALEVDGRLAERLAGSGEARLQVMVADALETDLGQWGPAVFAGNLPYYAATAIIERILGLGAKMRRGVFLVQKEVAARMAAQPGSRDYGYLSVAVQSAARVEWLFEVKPAAFDPPPKVDSAVVRLTPQARMAELGIADAADFLAFVSLCFRQKRKTLRNNLSAEYGAAADGLAEGGLRAEQISVELFADLYGRLAGKRPQRVQ